jgi:hypothetical protein
LSVLSNAPSIFSLQDLISQRERNKEDSSAGRTSEDAEQFISLGDEPGEQQRTRTPSGPDAEEASTSGRREVVWGGAMHRIKSPLLRLHNGKASLIKETLTYLHNFVAYHQTVTGTKIRTQPRSSRREKSAEFAFHAACD